MADVLVIFGITGDLARKMTFRALYRLERRGLLDCQIIGVARRTDWGHDTLRSRARESIEETVGDFDEDVFKRLAKRLHLTSGDYSDPETYHRLKRAMGEAQQPLFYLEIPPSLFSPVVHQLGEAGLTDGAQVILEKPFGHDQASAEELQASLREVLDEDQILRIDHFLGKEPVMDISYLRFANAILEPVWNREHVAFVQLTMGEDFGVEGRGGFYDPVGALRDVFQNHLLQILALVAMEPPSGGGHPDEVRDHKLDLFRAMPPLDPKRYVRGQYKGYRDIEGVAPDSETETFVAVEATIENWRWHGVPFFIRAGKKMPAKVTEVNVLFKRPPPIVGGGGQPERNRVTIRIDPVAGARMRFLTKAAGEEEFEPADFEVLFDRSDEVPEPYERLLADALAGRNQLFVRYVGIEEEWRIVQPLLDHPPLVEEYDPGTWGPKSAEDLTRGICSWVEPWLPPPGDYAPS